MDAMGEGKDAAHRERKREREIAKPDPLTSFKGTALFIESNVHEIPLPPKREAHLRICSAQYSRVIGREKLVANNVRIIHLTNLSILEERKKRDSSFLFDERFRFFGKMEGRR